MVRQVPKSHAVYRNLFRPFLWSLVILTARQAISEEAPLSLIPERRLEEASNVEVLMQVGGDLLLTLPGEGIGSKVPLKKVPMNVTAKLLYDEQPLALRQTSSGTNRAVRYYHSAKALVEVQKGQQKPSLSDEHRIIVVESTDAETMYRCPNKPLVREELDLIDVPANTLILDDLLPSESVTVGQSWKHSDTLIASLLRLDAVSLGEVQSMLTEVDTANHAAKISLAGTVHGAVGGVATEIELKAKYTFDQKLRRVTLFALLIKEKRSVGHVGPGLDIVAKQIVKIKPISESPRLNEAVAAESASRDEMSPMLAFESPLNRFRLEHDLRWFVTSDDKKLTVFRLIDRGELVAQCNIATLDAVPAGEKFGLAEFQRDIEKSLDKKFGQFVSAKEETNKSGQRVYRVVVQGTVSEMPIQWVYYLFTTQPGRRLSVAFTMEQDLVDRFGQADQQFLSALEISPAQTASTGTPTPAAR